MVLFYLWYHDAGPAGAIAAYSLAERGYHVLIIDKSNFPRYKACGGGLTEKVFKVLPFDISEVVEQRINKVSFTYRLEDHIIRETGRNVMVCVMRERFDDFLLQKAINSGATLLDGSEVISADQQDDHVRVNTANQSYQSEFLIGADGARSKIAGIFKLLKQKQVFLAIGAEVEVGTETLEKFKNLVHLEWGLLPAGYGWIFPMGHNEYNLKFLLLLSIGVGSATKLGKYLGPYYRKFTEKLNLDIINTISYRSYQIPFRYNLSSIQNNRVLVAGDAAGLTDPLTGEGIFYAMQSGVIAAESIDKFLRNGRKEALEYEHRVNMEIMPDLFAVDQLKNMFFILLPYFHKWIKTNDSLWSAFVRVLAGDKAYSSFRNNFGRLKPAYPLFNQSAKVIQKFRIQKFNGKKLKLPVHSTASTE